jgi:hypothetical protein
VLIFWTSIAAAADVLTVGHSTGGPITTIGTSPDGSQLQYLNNAQYPLLLNGFCFDQIVTLLIPPSMSGLGSAPTFEFAFSDGFVPPQGWLGEVAALTDASWRQLAATNCRASNSGQQKVAT